MSKPGIQYHVTRAKIRDDKLRNLWAYLNRRVYKCDTDWHAHCGVGMKADDSDVQYFWVLCGDELGHLEFCPKDDKGIDGVAYGEQFDGINVARVDVLRAWLDTPREQRQPLGQDWLRVSPAISVYTGGNLSDLLDFLLGRGRRDDA